MAKSSSWALICVDGKFLFTLRSQTTSRPGQWCLPGGGKRSAESLEEACEREVREEVGLAVKVESLVCEDGGFHYFMCQPADAEPRVTLCLSECSEFRWVRPEELTQLGPIMEFKRMQRVFKILGTSITADD